MFRLQLSLISVGHIWTDVIVNVYTMYAEQFLKKKFMTNIFILCSLGATPMMELMIAAGKAVAQLQIEHGLAVERVFTGSFMTALDMAGTKYFPPQVVAPE